MWWIIIFGFRSFGRCDYFKTEAGETLYVTTQFFHISFLPLSPRQSYIAKEGPVYCSNTVSSTFIVRSVADVDTVYHALWEVTKARVCRIPRRRGADPPTCNFAKISKTANFGPSGEGTPALRSPTGFYFSLVGVPTCGNPRYTPGTERGLSDGWGGGG